MKPVAPAHGPRLLALELWGLGDLAIALPFLRSASERAAVTLVAKPHAAALLARFAPAVELVPFTAPWTAFTGKYRLTRWHWGTLFRFARDLRGRGFDVAVSARPDPRDHALLAVSRARRRIGFARAGSSVLLTDALSVPAAHRSEYWMATGRALGWKIPPIADSRVGDLGRRIVIHTGAARPVREWPKARFDEIAARLRAAGWEPEIIDAAQGDEKALIEKLSTASRFIGNDSGPGHIAALLGIPTFTIFGPQLPESFAPTHPRSAWIEGRPCDYKPCFDSCHYPEPHCLLGNDVDKVWDRMCEWLSTNCSHDRHRP